MPDTLSFMRFGCRSLQGRQCPPLRGCHGVSGWPGSASEPPGRPGGPLNPARPDPQTDLLARAVINTAAGPSSGWGASGGRARGFWPPWSPQRPVPIERMARTASRVGRGRLKAGKLSFSEAAMTQPSRTSLYESLSC
eukprot:scaffold100655_cov47-Prasinocladus_malaysianus.AAC.2